MKITSIDIIDVANDFSSATSKWRPTVVRVNTDEGISGFGEVGLAYGVGASGGIGVAKDLSALLIGMNPMDTEAIWEKMLRKTFWGQGGGIFSAAMSGLDIAMWDIKGKALNVPLYVLLGGDTARLQPDTKKPGIIRAPAFCCLCFCGQKRKKGLRFRKP